ncbi:DPP IV N-terminal domain-containing protein [Patescibacteria group bacterium]|nr:DPP IV N-terminal domain-containing protein [Patescibacteria group bacterium]
MEDREQNEQGEKFLPQPSPKKKYLFVGVIIALVVLIGGGILVLSWQKETSQQFEVADPQELIADPTTNLIWTEKDVIPGFLRTGYPYSLSNSPWRPDGLKFLYVVDWNLWVRNVENNTSQRLTDLEDNIETAAWSPDGTKIAYVSDKERKDSTRAWGKTDVWIMNADGSDKKRLTGDKLFNERFDVLDEWDWPLPDTNILWSPDGEHILIHIFVRPASLHNTSPAPDQLWIVDSEGGTNESKLAEIGWVNDRFAWSGDNQTIRYYASNEIVTIDTDGNIVMREQTDHQDQFLYPAREKKIFLINNISAVYTKKGIWIAHYNDEQAVQLIEYDKVDFRKIHIVWSSDSTKAVIEDVERGVWFVDVVSNQVKKIVDLDAFSKPARISASWSPDGKYIFLFVNQKGMWLVDSASLQMKKIEHEGFPEVASTFAVWSSDSKYVVLSVEEIEGAKSLWIMDKTGSRMKKINDKEARQIVWSPDNEHILIGRYRPESEISLLEGQ